METREYIFYGSKFKFINVICGTASVLNAKYGTEMIWIEDNQIVDLGGLGRGKIKIYENPNNYDQCKVILEVEFNETEIEKIWGEIRNAIESPELDLILPSGTRVEPIIKGRSDDLGDQKLGVHTDYDFSEIEKLTPTETAVLQALAIGMTNSEIAKKNFKSIYTVQNQRKAAIRKLKVHRLEDAIEKARTHLLIK